MKRSPNKNLTNSTAVADHPMSPKSKPMYVAVGFATRNVIALWPALNPVSHMTLIFGSALAAVEPNNNSNIQHTFRFQKWSIGTHREHKI